MIFFSFSGDTVSFVNNKEKENQLNIGVRDTNVVIDWTYNLPKPDILKDITFGYFKENDNVFNIAIKIKGQPLFYNPDIDNQDKNNIIVEADDTSVAKIILKEIILNYENKRKYFCRIRTTDGGGINSRVIVNVYGKYIFFLLYFNVL